MAALEDKELAQEWVKTYKEEKQAGTILWDIDINKRQRELTLRVNKKINKYFESKISKYLKNKGLDFYDWSLYGACKCLNGRCEYFYKDTFIAGVEICSKFRNFETYTVYYYSDKIYVRYY